MLSDEDFRLPIDSLSREMFAAVQHRGPVRFDVAVGAVLHLLDIMLRSAPDAERETAAAYVCQALAELTAHIRFNTPPSRPAGRLN
jgi:hypothetical protein